MTMKEDLIQEEKTYPLELSAKERVELLELASQVTSKEMALTSLCQLGLVILTLCVVMALTKEPGYSFTLGSVWALLATAAAILCQERKQALKRMAEDVKRRLEKAKSQHAEWFVQLKD